jgi:uncharacterized membrane protein
MYNLLKFIHIVSVTLWIGGLITIFLLNLRMSRAGQSAAVAALGQHGQFFGMAMFGPAALLTLLTGIGMVLVANYSFGLPWISWGFAGAILSFILGGGLTAGTARRMAKESDPAVIAKLRGRMTMFAVLNMLILLSVVAAMVFKPAAG